MNSFEWVKSPIVRDSTDLSSGFCQEACLTGEERGRVKETHSVLAECFFHSFDVKMTHVPVKSVDVNRF